MMSFTDIVGLDEGVSESIYFQLGRTHTRNLLSFVFTSVLSRLHFTLAANVHE